MKKIQEVNTNHTINSPNTSSINKEYEAKLKTKPINFTQTDESNESIKGNLNIIHLSSNQLISSHSNKQQLIKISTLKLFFQFLIKGFKSVKTNSFDINRKGKQYSISENLNAYFKCLNTEESINEDYLDELKTSISELNPSDFKNSLKNIIRVLRRIVIAIGERCTGIEDIIDFIDEFIIKAKNIRFPYNIDESKIKALEMINKNAFEIGGLVLGQIFGEIKKYVNFIED